MERTEPTFVPEWLKSSGSLSTISHQFTSSSLHPDDQGVSKSLRTKSLVNSGDNDLGRTSVSDRTTSSYFRRTSSSNGAAHLRSYNSFSRNHRDRDWDKDIYEFRDKEKSDNRHRDYSDHLANILPSRFEKDGLRRSHSSLSAKRGESWPRKVAGDKNGHNNGSALPSVGTSSSSGKAAFERDFPSLGAEEKQADTEIGRVPSPGLTTAIQSLPIGSSAVICGDMWTSALAEVPMIVGSNGSNISVQQPIQPTSVSATTSMTTGRNMAETLAQGPSRARTTPQLSVGTQRLEELAVKQSRQLIPMTPSMPKALALNSSDKPKLKVGQSQLQNSHIVNHPPSLRPVSVKSDVTKVSTVGKLHILKSSRERNGTTSTAKESLSPTGGSKLPNSPLAVPVVVGSASLRNTGGSTIVADRKPCVEKRPSPQAQSRNDFFNLMRKKSMATNSSSPGASEAGSSESTNDKPGEPQVGGYDPVVVDRSCGVQTLSENKVDFSCNGDATERSNNEKNHSSSDAILYSEEEEARFLRSLGWEETTEEEGLTEEEINSFYRDYVNLKTASNFFKGTQPKSLMPLNLQMGKNGDS
ncbi:uncharacterized protein LOC112501173 isoform X2 [Cynara cardunculus var. scolymus]|uniref:uncharacterized protein LOC112501173 isoform X2 n=1 Tax=Cynara cardunculus var. scolymus TaxID=59895 RepID=UPI000D627560|nr:uncharacterized protein LOC112501173 isoform X2 [Cynara cardunculus var. scolymus]